MAKSTWHNLPIRRHRKVCSMSLRQLLDYEILQQDARHRYRLDYDKQTTTDLLPATAVSCLQDFDQNRCCCCIQLWFLQHRLCDCVCN